MKCNAPRWTPKEDEKLRSVKGKGVTKVCALLPGRTSNAIKSRRRVLGLCKVTWLYWTKSEDKRLLKYKREPLKKQQKRFKGRTCEAIENRRRYLGLTSPKNHCWLGSEIKRLKARFSIASRSELLAEFPRHPWPSIEKVAAREGLSRARRHCVAPGSSLHEQVRQRAKEDGVSLVNLGMETNCGYFFSSLSRRDDYNKIARAVAFFGGRLVIDWQDE